NNVEPRVFELLLDAGADINSRTNYGITPLHWAALSNSEPAIIELLLTAGADPTLTNDGGDTPLDHIEENDRLKNTRAHQLLRNAMR
ncbi:MAG: ankyrin repeat domain-containing protein, partial [Betaproteobacteria bacterium]|nr:ankyrin repeat domain-containing protein [Betaproteobacteria bacterium]